MLPKCLLLLLVVIPHKLSAAAEAEGGPGGCGPLPLVDHTKPIEGQTFPENHRFRYKCEDGFIRKAGTSNLYKCVKDQIYHWRNVPKLECIPDPNLPAVTKAPEQTPTTIKASTESVVALVENTTTSTTTVTTTTTTATSTVSSSATPKPLPVYNENAVVSGSVVGVVLLVVMSAVVFFLYTRQMLPW
ncbi:uncharacterized protein LOC134464551 isoform X2 [Engraulis encrasicolus]|uniref:uncharacterized protein LOC134464551 isoform X2 n=1 Tax=Engraulis encrasicolus TaxID=184585 RepID=UPI002FD5AD00